MPSTSATELTLRQRREQAAERFAGRRVRNEDYGDYQLLHLVDDNEGKPTVHFAELLEVEPMSVGQRFSWMKRKGLIRAQALRSDRQSEWYVAAGGRKLLDGQGQHIETLQHLAKTLSKSTSAGWVARREFGRNLR